MATWNHRVMRWTDAAGTHVGVFEVYYTPDGRVDGWTKNPVSPMHSLEDEGWSLEQELDRFKEALTKPVLDHETGLEVDGDPPPEPTSAEYSRP